jgi:HK97 family phage major capsid protein
MPVKSDPGRLKELNTALQTKAHEIESIGNTFKIDDAGNVEISTEQHDAYVKALNQAEEIKKLIVTEEQSKGIFEFLGESERPPAAASEAAQAARSSGFENKSLGERWLESSSYSEMKESSFNRLGQIAEFERALELKDVYSNMAGTIPNINALGRPQDLGLTPRVLRPGRIRDLFPAEETTANVLYGIRETGFTNNAAVVPERRAADGTSAPTGGPTDVFGLKPRSTLSFVPVTYPLATIAHVIYVHKQTLMDEPRMRGLIDRDLVDGIKMVEDEQILYGNGVGDNLTGIINTSGVQTYTGDAADPLSAQIRRGITRAILAYFPPTGLVLHPLDWENLELERDDNGAYRLAVNIAIGGEKRVWRINLIETPAINEGQYLMGAFGIGAKLYDRYQVNIAVNDLALAA